MKRINIQSLETLCCIARLGTFQAAAEQLFTTQPSVSARIKELESAIGVPLFHKHGRRMVLTNHGRELVQNLEPLLLKIEDVLTSVDPSATTGIVRLGVGEIVALTWLPAMVVRLKQLMPRVIFQIEVGLTVRLRQKLEVGEIDIAIMSAPVALHQVSSAAVGSVRMSWMVSPKLKASMKGSKLSVQELFSSFPLWTISRPSAIYPLAVESLKSIDALTTQINTCDSNACLVKLVSTGAGFGLVPEILAQESLASGELILVSKKLVRPALEFAIAWNTEREQSITLGIVRAAIQSSTFAKA